MESDGEALTGLWFTDRRPKGLCEEYADKAVFRDTARWLDIYFSGHDPCFLPPLRLEGTPFRQRVCERLLRIPYGKTVSYGAVAREMAEEDGRKTFSAQAVGGAVGHNPVSIIVPCHRVIGSDGSLTGYGGGLDRKLALLRLEGIMI